MTGVAGRDAPGSADRGDVAAAGNAAATERDLADLRAAEVARELEEAPENLPPKAWITLGIFALFVVGAGGCMVNLFLR
ncbi:hypothetical protein GCM10011490_00940 [Pseudoclavibacter endophyticus]|uniref:Uncharacterized protein n=1 Tax=Pseudoclavibacter endophyticus TaxID=1778590 RepID=A0A6H9WNA3_9MICO|nr:hypothetical protein [Pseudoclavibacter endophyticus]KAB1650346.1 hypothetical protein F8O04_09235 [Pseudoclavibacter endophyticus]GGA54931.1 hypothetical protein GCM10011490_00940 [Pseudoclavibacter endophyticus]